MAPPLDGESSGATSPGEATPVHSQPDHLDRS